MLFRSAFLVLEPLAPSAAWLLLGLTSTLNYGAFAPPADRATFHPSLTLRLIEFGLPLLLAIGLAIARHRGMRRSASDA